MSWEERYREQATNARQAGQHAASRGADKAARYWMDVADTYEKLIKEVKDGSFKKEEDKAIKPD